MTRDACFYARPRLERDPRRARSPLPPDAPRRSDVAAALALAGLLTHLLLAQLTLLLAVALDLAAGSRGGGRCGWAPRPRPGSSGCWPSAPGGHWLASPPDRTRCWATWPGRSGSRPGLHPARAFAGIGRWLPRQAPLALLLAPAEAAIAWWLRWRRAGAQGLPPPRPGLIVAARRQLTVAWVRSGGVVSRTGACLGADQETGRPAGISWCAAEGGVLVTGAVPADGPGPASSWSTRRSGDASRSWWWTSAGPGACPGRLPGSARTPAPRCTRSGRPGRAVTSRGAAAGRGARPRWSWG